MYGLGEFATKAIQKTIGSQTALGTCCGIS